MPTASALVCNTRVVVQQTTKVDPGTCEARTPGTRMTPETVSLSTFEKILSIKVHELEDNLVGLVIRGMNENDNRVSKKS